MPAQINRISMERGHYLEEEEDLVLQTNDEMCSSCNGTKLDMSKETLHPSDLDSGLAAYRTYVDLCT